MITINILLLNIGSNPLPNYVVTKYLLTENREDIQHMPIPNQFIFLHSSKTERYAKKIRAMLKLFSNSVKLHNLGESERNSEHITKSILSILAELQKKQTITSIHLNYTGGTKPMAVHSFQAVSSYAKGHEIKVVFSDLNHSSFKIVLDKGDYSFPTSGDLREYVKLTIKEMFEMHLMDYKDDKYTPFFKDPNDFAEFILKGFEEKQDLLEPRYHVRYIKEAIDDNSKKFDKKDYKNQFENNIYKYLSSFLKRFDEYSLNEFKGLIEWLHGKWLEEYVFLTIQQLAEPLKLTEVQMSVYAKYNNRDCEIDVVVMKGYQLYVISCTTSKKLSRIKNKAFEAMYRAEQLGGGHANVIVVTTIREKKKQSRQPYQKLYSLEDIKNDLSSFDAMENKKVELIGLETVKHPDFLKVELEKLLSY
ncbi:MAG TPA: DUF1887 family protein [Bacillus bacterium]|nr:DUF1887 family protein [Bacillus sp. (in: firmicutes)]